MRSWGQRPRSLVFSPRRDQDFPQDWNETEIWQELGWDLFGRPCFCYFYIFAIWLFKMPTYAMATLQAACYLCIAYENDDSSIITQLGSWQPTAYVSFCYRLQWNLNGNTHLFEVPTQQNYCQHCCQHCLTKLEVVNLRWQPYNDRRIKNLLPYKIAR